MYQKIFENKIFFLIFLGISVVFINLISWYPNFFIDFLNDDYQIIGIHNPKSFIDCFSPFVNSDILGSYWRPAVNSIHRIIIYFFGFNPLVFHFTNWLIYTISKYLFGILLYKLDFKKYAIPGAILFSVLPAHEIVVGWLSGRNETFMLVFLLINAIILSKENIKIVEEVFYYLCFSIAILTKESAYIAAFMPVLFYIYQNGFKIEKEKFIKISRLVLIPIILIALSLFYRFTVIGSNPAESSHFTDLSLMNLLKNFAVSIPLTVFTADNLEMYYYLFQEKFFLAIIGIVGVFITLTFFKYVQYFFHIKDYRKIVFGILWFLLFIIPPLPNMMRWYVLTASIGLFIAFISFFEQFRNSFTLGKVGIIGNWSFFFVIVLILSFVNYSKMNDWVLTSQKTQQAIKSIGSLDLTGVKNLYLWAAPDKINRINSMKLGIEHSINIINNSNYNVINPLKAEINYNSHIKGEFNDSLWKFEIEFGRFLPFKGKSMLLMKNEKYELKDDLYKMNIETIANDSLRISRAIISEIKKDSITAHIYYNGEKFIRIK